jgi:hypothetical protein
MYDTIFFCKTIGDLRMLLTKHEGESFHNQTIYISGQAFIRCTFVGCTLVLREAIYHMEGCSFERCNWHIDRVLMWGYADSLRVSNTIVTMVEQAREQHMAPQQANSTTPEQ